MSLLPDQSKLIELAKAKMPYGKFKGRFLIDLPEHYIVWYKQKGFPKGKLGNQLEQIFEIKVNGLEPMIRTIRDRF
ncbi:MULTISPECIES: DUF3820 family protein [Croceibacter]|uniref:Cytoplasmic protein n=1 Tax=Croceibacter atlanticus (strain ATCC BAA-628 / JCM 21780 / CIP 108009 / IAM 15332 / KCTC 12090 / HTCC2559) TaxID=216432 RepID=A3UBQ1_CROAH|nr:MULTISPECIES: DUF3820 family protein [Croceibacter]EAP86052.1 hypothetical protein CA2559_08466 [Croceibacter atlanticus HTCC2559]MBG26381.1 hypothetical protein [Croceibacter sp.]WSP33731.1 DUF3820 family protein [Croceibacter atlanticus]